ncbi:MAG TPA: hypothetical protein VIJ39_15405 [Solirubrobacteraceae bacterium]
MTAIAHIANSEQSEDAVSSMSEVDRAHAPPPPDSLPRSQRESGAQIANPDPQRTLAP